jgi:hypothetical protein
MRKIGIAVSLLLLAAGAAVAQQGSQPITYYAEYRVNPGQESTFVDWIKKYDKPVFDKLQGEGLVMAWGLDARFVHRPGGTTHLLWWVTKDYDGMDKTFAALRQISPAVADQEKFRQATDASKHQDSITRNILQNIQEGEPSAPPFTSWSYTKVDVGKGLEWRKLWEKYNKPVYDKLVKDGVIFGYGIDVEDIHTEDPGWRGVWVVTTSMAAFDKIDAAFAADRQGRSEEEREAIGRQFREITSPSDHRDSLWRAIPMKEGGM